MRERFLKENRLRTRSNYQAMAHAKRLVGSYVLIDLRPNGSLCNRLGLTVTKRFGKAVVRNRFKRLVRESFRLLQSQLIKGYDFNVRPRSLAVNAKLDGIQQDFMDLLHVRKP